MGFELKYFPTIAGFPSYTELYYEQIIPNIVRLFLAYSIYDQRFYRCFCYIWNHIITNLSHHDGIYYFPSLQGFAERLFPQYFVIYENLYSPVLRKSYLTPTYQWTSTISFSLNDGVIIIYFSPVWQFCLSPTMAVSFSLPHQSSLPRQRASHEPVSFNKEKMQGFQRGNYKQGTSQRKKSSLSSNDDLLSLTTGSSSMDFSYI